MDREKVTNEIMDLFIRVVNKYNGLEKVPVKHSPGLSLYHSERHMLDRVADNPHMNITELARASGVTKGAISQIAKKARNQGSHQEIQEGRERQGSLYRTDGNREKDLRRAKED